MTAQISDLFRYRGQDYAVTNASADEFFELSTFGLRPVPTVSACWRGYQAVYALADAQLVLDTIHITLRPQQTPGPSVLGVRPTGKQDDYDWFNNHYLGLAHPLAYTGELLLGRDFISNLNDNMGFQPAWKYRTVLALAFEAGVLTGVQNVSQEMAAERKGKVGAP